jgi:hypothetical protein
MRFFTKLLILSTLFHPSLAANAQRTYKSSSVLATGNWYRISVSGPGVYKIDLPFLASLGISGQVLSSQIRLFGNGGGMLSEANNGTYTDDLEENAIMVMDGGDGILNGSDHFLFYAAGPHHWIPDSINRKFGHRRNLYTDKSYYYIQVGGNGKRITEQTNPPPGGVTVTSFDEYYFHELDTVNFLSSGKEWYGEEFANTPGRTLSRTFNLPLSDLVTGLATIVTSVAARSISIPSRFNVSVNGQAVQQLSVFGVSTGIYDLFAQQATQADAISLAQSTANIQVTYTPGSFNSQGWLNWFEFFARRNLVLPQNGQLSFRDWTSVNQPAAEFVIGNAAAETQVWDITNPLVPLKMKTVVNGNQVRFSNEASRLHQYISFTGNFLIPRAEGPVANQNLHNTTLKDYLIITHPSFLSQAERLARFHEQRTGIKVQVVTTEQVYHEFGGGSADPSAIRDFVKMYHDRYRGSWNASGKYLLLFGKASFDFKSRVNNNTGFVPSYQSSSSLDPLSTYTSDDFFGFLEDVEDINSGLLVNTLDIGIGRVPAKNMDEARNFVDKVEAYHSASSFGPWRNNLNFIADDEDQNIHLQDAEVLNSTVKTVAPVFNPVKIYLDAFLQEGGSAGGRYPQANAMVNSNIFNGTLIWNYSGHGGALRLAEETVVDQQIVNSWNNPGRLPLFITATCDFAPYDNPTVNSLGENLLVRPKTGAIALMTTTRVVFAYSNRIMNNNYLKFALEPDASQRYRTLGEAVMAAKNFTYQTSGDITNNRKFVLLGDPAMTLGFPRHQVRLTKVNGQDVVAASDTLSAAEFVSLEGEVADRAGNLLPGFNGLVSVTVFDKEQQLQTRANDPLSQPVTFQDQTAFLFRGKATARNGKFSLEFRVPRDINYQYGFGKVSLYANDAATDGNGASGNIVIGGISNAAVSDVEGPEIKAYMNDDRFVNGGITDPAPVLIVKLADSSGINTGGSGIDHDLVATLDNDNRKYFILNSFYESDLDDYQKGTVRFQLPGLEPGPHTLKIKAWDVLNHSSEYVLDFTVVKNEEIRIDHVLNYPNPFTTSTQFWFEHNQAGQPLAVKVEVFTVSGKLIKTISRTINNGGNRSSEVSWDGRDDFGNKPGKGVYIYRLLVTDINGRQASKWERLVLL